MITKTTMSTPRSSILLHSASFLYGMGALRAPIPLSIGVAVDSPDLMEWAYIYSFPERLTYIYAIP